MQLEMSVLPTGPIPISGSRYHHLIHTYIHKICACVCMQMRLCVCADEVVDPGETDGSPRSQSYGGTRQ